MPCQVFTFARVPDDHARKLVYEEIFRGKSRFGMWDQEKSLKDDYYGPNAFLLRICQGDWIVHVNCPEYGKCVAVNATGEYAFDSGLRCSWGTDFCNFIPVDCESAIEFDRNDPNILPTVNLAPMRRGQRILAVDDFIQSINNLKANRFDQEIETKSIIHLREKIRTEMLPQLTERIQQMNRSKEFERFLYRIFERMPNTLAIQNGFGWKSDHGADLIVDFQVPVIEIKLKTRIVVQAKSFTGEHYDTKAVDQLVEAVGKFQADAGLLITTGRKTENLESYMLKMAEQTGKSLDLIAGPDVARFVLRYAPDLLVG